ncbi:MAG: ABC transporter permease [Sedimentisphaerales bacterium]
MTALWQDIRYGFRMLVRNPGFTAVVVVVLAVSIGATTAMLSVVDAVMLRPCPYKDSDTLVCVYETNTPESTRGNFTSLAGFLDWREQSHVFERLIGANQWNGVVRTADRTEKARAFFVSPEFFSVLGAKPILGRVFLPEEHRRGGGRVAVLSHDHWCHWFASDPNVIGKTLILDKEVYTVIGVLPEDFRWIFQGIACGLWMPMPLSAAGDTNRNNRGLQAIARLKPGVSVAQAQAEMDLIAERLAQEYPDTNTNRGILVVPMNEDYAGMTAGSGKPQILLILLGIVSSVLLIACLHVASLLIARSATREKEIAVRAALGAQRLRLARQLLTESVLLALLGGLVGFLLAHWGLGILSAMRGRSIPWYLGTHMGRLIPWFVDIRMDGRSLLYIMCVSLLTCGLFGVLPAIGTSKTNLSRSLSAGRTPSRGPRFHNLRAFLVICDVAIAFVLLIAAGLMINSLVRIINIDPRFNPKNVLSVEIELDYHSPPYSEPNRRLAFFQDAVQRIRNSPGAEYVTAASASPVTGSYSTNTFRIEGRTPGDRTSDIPRMKILADYFQTLQIPLLRGRCFAEHETATSAPVVIINESMARRFWPDENPIGKHITRITRDGPEPISRQVVGVVGNVQHSRYSPDEPELYLSGCDQSMNLMIRTRYHSAALAAAIRRELMAVDENVVVGGVTLMEDDISNLYSSERFSTLFLGAFAALALFLASIGVYGTSAYAVTRRTHEIGIRIALGARSGDVQKTILLHGLKLTLIGLAIGLVGAFAGTRIIRSLLHDVSPIDPVTFVCVSLLLAGVAMLASYIPARRAAKIDPMEALRYE